MHLTQAKLSENLNESAIQMINQKKALPKPGVLPETRTFRQIRKKNNDSMSVPHSTGNRSIMQSQHDSDYSMLATPDITQMNTSAA